MGLRIATNVASLAAQRALSRSSLDQAKTYEKLASGNRITKAGDDAAGLSISEHLRSQIRGYTQATRNANDGISFVQVAEGGLTEISNVMIRLKELAVQAASDTIGDTERQLIQHEVTSLTQEVDRIAQSTNFNEIPLLSGESGNGELQFQVGIRDEEYDRITFDPNEINSTSEELGVADMDYTDIESAREMIAVADQAMDKVFSSRAKLGAVQNKMQSTVNNLQVLTENLSQARSRISDADLAVETSELVRGNILQSAGVSVLGQANQAPMQVLKLL